LWEVKGESRGTSEDVARKAFHACEVLVYDESQHFRTPLKPAMGFSFNLLFMKDGRLAAFVSTGPWG